MPRRYTTRAENIERAYRVLLGLPSSSTEVPGFVLLTENPVPRVASELGIAPSHARKILLDLAKAGIYKHQRDGNTHSWRLKLPPEQNEQLELGSSDEGEFEPPEWLNDFKSFCQSVGGLPEKLEAVLRENARLREQNAELTGELSDLRAENEHFRQKREAMRKLVDED